MPVRPLPRPWRRCPALTVFALVAAGVALAGGRPAEAQDDGGSGGDTSGVSAGGVSTGGHHAGVAPELAGIEVRSATVSEAADVVVGIEVGIEEAAAAQVDAAARLQQLADERVAVEADRAVRTAELADAEARGLTARQDLVWLDGALVGVQQFVDRLAVAAYIGAGDEGFEVQTPVVAPGRQRAIYSRALLDLKRAERAQLVAALEEAAGRLERAEADAGAARTAIAAADGHLVAIEAARVGTAGELDGAVVRQQDLIGQLDGARAELAEARRTGEVTGLGMRLVVLDALWKATLVEYERRPECQLDWTLLAAISHVEGRHGTFGGATVDRDGDVVPRILGPALDGVNFALITDTDGGRYDGDTVFDRAVGPMQFIPSSWTIYGEDADGSGFDDPNNVYDATLAAAEHLCRGGWDVSTAEGRRGALFSYNQSDAYRLTVEAWQQTYVAALPEL